MSTYLIEEAGWVNLPYISRDRAATYPRDCMLLINAKSASIRGLRLLEKRLNANIVFVSGNQFNVSLGFESRGVCAHARKVLLEK